jgi:arsenate reductase
MSASDFPITIFHNPACGTSRNVVAMAKAAGYEPQVVEYLKAGWTKDQLRQLAKTASVPLREFLRDRGTPAAELGLLEPTATDDAILEAMVAHPILVNRPIMVTPKGTALCRPSEKALDLLENQPEGFAKEDGQKV